jgi:integrase
MTQTVQDRAADGSGGHALAGEWFEPDANALMFPGMQARARKPLATPIHPDHWLRLPLCPVAKKLGIAFHPTFQVFRRGFSTHGKKEAHPRDAAQLGHSDIRTPPWTSIHRLPARKWPEW